MENLSNKKVYIRDIFDKKLGYCCVENLDKFFGKDCPLSAVENFGDREYYHLLTKIPYGKDYYPGIKSSPYIIMVENGIFKGSACIVEENNGLGRRTDIAIISDKKIFKFPSFEGILSASEIDYVLGENGLCDVLSNALLSFDITKQYQYYQYMCEDLPAKFWKNKNTVARLLRNIENGDFVFENVYSSEFVNKQAVKRLAKDTVLSYAQKNLDLAETEIEK